MIGKVLFLTFQLLLVSINVLGHQKPSANETDVITRSTVLMEWTPPKGLKERFSYQLIGYDYENRPVLLAKWGIWDFRSITDKGGQELDDLETYLEQFIERFRNGFYKRRLNESEVGPHDDEVAAILDFDGFNLRQIGSSQSMKYLLRCLRKIEVIYERFAYAFIVNANPFVQQLLQLAKPLAGNFLARVEIYGTSPRKWIPQLIKKIPITQLPPGYGGYKSFRPIASYG